MKELPDKAHYRPDEVAEYFDIKLSTLYQWIAEGKVNGLKVAGMRCVRITREEIEKMKRPVIE
jgi:excisionase family DNA binding protein